MSMDLMPDDCLLTIFNFIEDPRVLFRCLRVCRRWHCLVSYRLAKVENLIDEFHYSTHKFDEKTLCYYPHRPLEEPILSGILKKSPNLKIVSIGLEYKVGPDKNYMYKSLDRLSRLESLKGIVLNPWSVQQEVTNVPQTIELLYSYDIAINSGYFPKVKQLILDEAILMESIHRFPNVVRLNLIADGETNEWIQTAFKKKYLFKKLKIIEIDTSFYQSSTDENYACQFIDLCPQVESANLRIGIDQIVSTSHVRHENLKNLVVTYVDYELVEQYYLNLLGLLRKYPNLKHLAIKYDTFYIDSNKQSANNLTEESGDESESGAEEESDDGGSSTDSKDDGIFGGSVIPFLIVSMLQKLVLLDMRNLTGVDENSAKYVQQYCENKNRSIKFYYGSTGDNEIKRDWPELFSDKAQDCQEYNFMKQLFLPPYTRRPFFLDPI